MSEKQKIHLVVNDGYPQFVVVINKVEEHYVDMDAYQVGCWDDAKSPASYEVDNHDPSKLSEYLSMTVKWDGCSHVYFGENCSKNEEGPDGYLHLCGGDHFRNHCLLMYEMYNLAFRLMGRSPKDENEEFKELVLPTSS